jgi:hypothetical protein
VPVTGICRAFTGFLVQFLLKTGDGTGIHVTNGVFSAVLLGWTRCGAKYTQQWFFKLN